MTLLNYPVIAWPFAVTVLNNVVECKDDPGTSTSTQTIPVGSYINQGNTLAAAPGDFLDAVAAELNDCKTALGLAGTWSVDLNDDGTVLITRAGGASPTDDLVIQWGAANSIFKSWLGFDAEGATTRFDASTTSGEQASHRWHPGVEETYDSEELQRFIHKETRNLRGRPGRVRYGGGTPWYERVMTWHRIPAARIKQSRSDDALYAAIADPWATGEDNTWETGLWRYLTGDVGPYLDHRVYIYDTNDAATAVRSAAYEIVLEESRPGLDGVGLRDFRQGESSEFFEVSLHFWRE